MISKAIFKCCMVLFLSVSLAKFCAAGLTKTEVPMKCHTCDPDTCKNFDRKAQPQECSVDKLERDNVGPSKLSQFTYLKHSKLDDPNPLFSCLKIDAYDARGNLNVLRKCQLRLSGNASCTIFNTNLNNDQERTYTNASCYLCDDKDGCNSSGFLYIFLPLVFTSVIINILLTN